MERNRSVSRFFFAYALLMPTLFSFYRFIFLFWTGINFLLTEFQAGAGKGLNEPALVGPSDFCKWYYRYEVSLYRLSLNS